MQIKSHQHTISNNIQLSGKGLHLGKQAHIVIRPAPVNSGIVFKRTDLSDTPEIKAHIDHISHCERGTCLTKNGIDILSIEHLMAAVQGLQVDNMIIEIDASEMPAFDGSSRVYTEELLKAGIQEQSELRKPFKLNEKIEFSYGDSKYIAEPSDEFLLDVFIQYDDSPIGEQKASYIQTTDFQQEIANCRTFVFLSELEPLFNRNLIKGGDLDNAIVFVDKAVCQAELDRLSSIMGKDKVAVRLEGILNNLDLYFDNEPARHKLLDLMGDLGLLGKMMQAKITAIRPGHRSNAEFVKRLLIN